MLDEIEQFLTGSSRSLELDRVLATVMCVCASATADEGSGAVSPDRIERFYAHARKELEWFRGGGFAAHPAGFISTFDGPARAIRCASALSAAAPRFGVDVRIGLHTGECDVRNDKISGVAVDTAAQVAGHAAPSEVLVSRTVKDLVAGSGCASTITASTRSTAWRRLAALRRRTGTAAAFVAAARRRSVQTSAAKSTNDR
jgi:class 3 adenylate cyclase